MDLDYVLWLQNLRERVGGTDLFVLVTQAAMPAAVILACWLYWWRDKELGIRALMSFAVGGALMQVLKATFCVARPWVRDSRIHPPAAARAGATGYSFPSGHTQTVTSIFACIGIDAWRRHARGVAAACVAAIVLVAFSRNFLGVHTPQDVLVGAAVGLVGCWLAERALAAVDTGRLRDTTLVAVGCALVCALLIYVLLKPYPAHGALAMQLDAAANLGGLAGGLLGWLCERRFVQFSTDDSQRSKLTRVVCSAALLAGLFALVLPAIKLAIGKSVAYELAKGLLAALIIIWMGPACAARITRSH